MTEPTRLLSKPESELERALLNAGRSYTGSSSTRAKTLLALGLTGATTSVAPSAAATSPLPKAALSKVAIAVLVIGAAAVPVWRYFNHANGTHTAPPPLNAGRVSQAPSATVEPATLSPAPATELPPASDPPAIAPPAAAPSAAAENAGARPPNNARSPGAARAEAKPASAPALAAELAALDAARSSLSHSDPSAALAALDGYSRDFPHGRLKMEAEVLRIGALAKSGQTDAARKRAEAFLRHHPDSVLASRVRSYAGL